MHHQKQLIALAEKIISEACNSLEKRTPNLTWRTACEALLEEFPADHPAWGFGLKFPNSNGPHQPPITFSLVLQYRKVSHRSWLSIERRAYSIAQQSVNAAFDKRCSPAAEALRSVYPSYVRHSQGRRVEKAWRNLTICRLCWRLAPFEIGFTHKQSVCDLHKARTSKYQQANRLLTEFKETLFAMLQERGNNSELINIIFPLDPTKQNPDHTPSTLALLADIYPFAIGYIRSQGKDFTDIRQLIAGLVGDSAENSPGIAAVKQEIERMTIEPSLVIGHLVHCEAWQSVYAKHPYGGRRKGAGCRPATLG